MENLQGRLVDSPSMQLDPAHLDLVELILGGLLEKTALDLGSLPLLPQPAVGDGAESTQSIVLADPDGTPLALVEYQVAHQDIGTVRTITDIWPLARPEHGAFRNLRITTPLADQPVVLFDQPPSPLDLRTLHQQTPLPANTCFVLVGSSSQAHGPQYAQAMDQLDAAAAFFEGVTTAHLVLPDSVETRQVFERLSTNLLADFRHALLPEPVQSEGVVVMFSGLSGSGKSTLARAVQERIHQDLTRRAVLLDGDDIRRFISKGLGFSREDRETNVERIGWIAARVSEVGGIALCAPIAPFEGTRVAVRALAQEVGQFFLIHVNTPLDVCEQRDRKGLYAKARAGLVKDFTGIDSPYEVPTDAELSLDLSVLDIPQATDQVLELLGLQQPSR